MNMQKLSVLVNYVIDQYIHILQAKTRKICEILSKKIGIGEGEIYKETQGWEKREQKWTFHPPTFQPPKSHSLFLPPMSLSLSHHVSLSLSHSCLCFYLSSTLSLSISLHPFLSFSHPLSLSLSLPTPFFLPPPSLSLSLSLSFRHLYFSFYLSHPSLCLSLSVCLFFNFIL